jgi:hypothetical protein
MIYPFYYFRNPCTWRQFSKGELCGCKAIECLYPAQEKGNCNALRGCKILVEPFIVSSKDKSLKESVASMMEVFATKQKRPKEVSPIIWKQKG